MLWRESVWRSLLPIPSKLRPKEARGWPACRVSTQSQELATSIFAARRAAPTKKSAGNLASPWSFDGDLADRSVHFVAPKVDFDTALMVLARQTGTFTRIVDAHTLFVTEDTAQKEREYAPEIEKNLVLPASVTAR